MEYPEDKRGCPLSPSFESKKKEVGEREPPSALLFGLKKFSALKGGIAAREDARIIKLLLEYKVHAIAG